MKPQIVRATFIWTLIAAFIFSSFPAGFADAGNSSQQNSKTSGTRRGKNGSSVNTNRSNPSVSQTDNSPATQTETQKAAEQKTPAASQNQSAAPADEKTGSDERPPQDNKIPTTFEEAQPKPQARREPLPFDRPPSGAQPSGNSANRQTPDFDRPASTSAQRSTRDNSPSPQSSTASQTQRPGVTTQQPPPGNSSPRSTTPTMQSQRYPSSGSDSQRYPSTNSQTTPGDNDPEPATRTTPPVLKRDREARNEGSNTGDSRGAPPVLRRSGDNTQAPSPSNPRNSTQSGSSQPPQDDSQDETIKLDATLVNIPILVSDRSNRYIAQLHKNDFMLYEDGVQQEVAFFGNEQVPFTVALLLDMSPSVQGNTEAIHDAAVDFVRQLRPDDRVMIISFDRKVDFLTDFTSDRRILERAIRSTTTGSGTSVYDAVYETVARRLRNVEGRKALILFSDGEDTTSSKASYDDAINIVTESDVLVYGLRYASDSGGGNIRVNPWPRSPIPDFPFPFPWPFPRRRRGPFAGSNLTGQPNGTDTGAPATQQWPRRGGRGGRGGDFMSDIAAAGGGPVFDAQTVGDMRGLANKIAEELRHVYQISYYPTNSLSNGGYRSIRIRVKNRDDIAIRHRKGYNAREVGKGTKI
jgi:Ca-activated chloride channel homolog